MTTTPRRVVLAAALSLVAFPFFSGSPVAAATAGAPLLQLTQAFPHGYIETTLVPGQTFATTVIVSDGGTVPADFLVSAVDGYTSSSGGAVYGNRQVPFRDGPTGNGEYGAGHWITLSVDHLALNPNQSQHVGISVTVPAGTLPGDWVGGVTIENPQGSVSGGGSGPHLNITEATEMAVVVHVPGPTTVGAIFLGQPTITTDGAQQLLNIPLRYTGDVLTKPTFSFAIRDSAGRVVYSHSGRFDTFVPHTTIVYQVRLTSVLLPGTYSFTGSAGPDGNVTSSSYPLRVTSTVIALPSPAAGSAGSAGAQPGAAPSPAFIVIPALALLLAAALLFVWRRSRNRCSHCARGRVGGLMAVGDFHEIAHCSDCRRRALQREEVRLCPECYRAHVRPTGGLKPRTA